MINISKVFKLKENLIFAINEPHSFKTGNIITDNKGVKYEVLGVTYQTNDLYVKPLSSINDIKEIKSIN